MVLFWGVKGEAGETHLLESIWICCGREVEFKLAAEPGVLGYRAKKGLGNRIERTIVDRQ